MIRALAGVAITLLLGGCAGSGAAWISASRFDYRLYAGEKVAVLPVRLHESVNVKKFPATDVQDAVADELYLLRIYEPTKVNERDAAMATFPHTPNSMVKFGKEHGYRAVVGVTMVRMDVAPWSKEWSITGNITFVDVEKPERRWTIAKTWQMTGSPGAKAVQNQFEPLLIGDFFDVRQALRRGAANVVLRRDTVVVDVGPILNLDVVKLESSALRKSRQRLVVEAAQKASGAPVGIAFDLFAIDDTGIASLVIDTADGCFRSVIFPQELAGAEATSPSSCDSPVQQAAVKSVPPEAAKTVAPAPDLPIYLANRAFVTLRPGENVVRATSTNGDQQTVVRTIKVFRQAPEKEGVDALFIFASSYDHHQPIAVKPEAAARVAQLVAQNGEFVGGNRTITLEGSHASRSDILSAVASEWSAPSAMNRRAVAFVGRAEEVVGRVYFYLITSGEEFPEIESLSVDEFRGMIALGVTDVGVDVCTRNTPPDRLKSLLKEALGTKPGPEVEISVTNNCSEPIGKAFLEFHDDLELK